MIWLWNTLKAAMESLDNPEDRAAGLLALRTVAEAYGGAAVAAEAELAANHYTELYHQKAIQPLKTLLAVP